MDPIAMVAQAVQPATDAKPTSAGADGKAGGVFELLMSRQIELMSGPINGLPKKKTDLADPMALWMMSALMQASQTTTPQQAEQAQADGALQAVEGIQPLEQADAKAGIANQAVTAAALFQWISANPEQFQALVNDLRTGSIDTAQMAEAISASLQSWEPVTNGPGGLQAADINTVLQSVIAGQEQTLPDVMAEADGNNGALKQIRELFAQALNAQLVDTERDSSRNMATVWKPDSPSANGQQAATAAGTPVIAVDVEIQASPAAGADKSSQAKDNAATDTHSGGQAAGDEEAVAFQAAMKAYHITTQAPYRSADPMPAEAVANATRPGTEAFDAIVQGISGLKDASAKEIQIELKPEFLGKVTIHLAMEEGGLVAKIAAANPRVQDSFLNQAQSLQSVLADQGLKDVRVVVTSSSVQDPNLQQQADRRSQNQQQQQKRHRFTVQAAETVSSPALQAYEALYNTSAINCLA